LYVLLRALTEEAVQSVLECELEILDQIMSYQHNLLP